MKFPHKKARLAEPYFEMTPMIDVVFQLIIFFMVVIQFGGLNVSADVRLPKADFAIPPAEERGGRIVLNYTFQNEWVVSNQVLGGVAAVENLLKVESRVAAKLPDGTPDLTVIIRADKMAPYERIVPVIQACAQLGVAKVAFMTLMPAPPP